MTTLKKLILTAVLTGAGAAGAGAQTTGSNTSSVGGNSTSSSSGGSNTLSSTAAFESPQITGLDSSSGATTRSSLQQSNILSGFYANPYFAGRAGATRLTAPGGFGTTLYTTTGGTSSISSGPGGSNAFSAAAGSTPVSSLTGFGGNTGSTGGFGTSTLGGFGGNTRGGFGAGANTGQNRGGLNQLGTGGFGGGQQAGGVVIASPGPIAYTATLRFATPKPTAPQVAADLRGILDRSSMLTNSRTIDLFTDGSTVVLRGTVPSAEEAETAEGMIRLTPGIFEVRNELQIAAVPPAPAAAPAPGIPGAPALPVTPAVPVAPAAPATPAPTTP